MRWRLTIAVVIMILSVLPTGIAGQTARERIAELKKPRFGPLHPDTTSRPRSNQALEVLRKLEKETGAKWKVQRWSNTTGGAEAIRKSSGDSAGNPSIPRGTSLRKMAESFVHNNWKIFLPSPSAEEMSPDLRYVWERSWNVRFQQYVNGLAVFGSWFDVSFYFGSIQGAGGQLYDISEIDASPSINWEMALEAIRDSEDYGADESRLTRPAELVIYPSKPARLMWSMQCTIHPTSNHASKHLLVDAKTGEIFDVTIPPLEFNGGGGSKRGQSQPNPRPRLNFRHGDSTHAPLDPTEFFFTLTDTSDLRSTAFARRLRAEAPDRYRHVDSVIKKNFETLRRVGAICDRGPATQDRNISRCFRVWPVSNNRYR